MGEGFWHVEESLLELTALSTRAIPLDHQIPNIVVIKKECSHKKIESF
jgi:hypothetical protein